MKKPFLHAGFLHRLEHPDASSPLVADAQLPMQMADLLAVPDGGGERTSAATFLIQVLKTYEAIRQAAFDTELAADELRRYQKFARPGQPSSHIVQLRQRQAAARRASNQSKQAFVQAAAAFVREAGIDVPERIALDTFITSWIDTNVPKG
ncbi:MAG TPA: hypothetical protein VGO76_08585 [Luteibacter sp.]|jgi:hypothetical protein|nr:hypothetical protein [Luteibacter sp.]